MNQSGSFFKLSKNETLGRYIVAAKDIKQGQLIIKEKPVILCPQIGGPTICFNCCAQIKKLHFCPKCMAAILCNPQCQGRFHTLEECSTIKQLDVRREDLITNPEMITPFRCLIWRIFSKDLFNKFLQLESHLDERRDSQIYRRVRTNVESALFKLKLINGADLQDETVQKICAILDVNTFDVRNRSGFNFGENLRGLYMEAAMMAHDCVANAHLAVDDDFVLYVYAAVDIPKGCPIFFNYTNVLQGNNERGSQLSNGKHFQCKCSRCEDPTELGTEMSSLKCPRCRKGLLRPKTWKCSFCGRVYHQSLVELTLMECQRRIDEVETPDVATLENLLTKLSTTFHPNHYLLLGIEQTLVRLYAQEVPTLKNLTRKIELCANLLDIFKKIEPGISRIQAIAMYELHSGLVKLEIDEEELLKKLVIAEDILKNSIRYLLYEPINSPEGRLAQNALRELKMLRARIGKLQEKKKKKRLL